jgi:hypothetical protein
MPAICCLGVVGNILNLVVLTRRNMKGIAYIYMRGKYRSHPEAPLMWRGQVCAGQPIQAYHSGVLDDTSDAVSLGD